MISFPSNLPQPSTSLSGDAAAPVIRTDIPNGLPVQEGRFSTGLETYRVQWVMSHAELSIFEEWFAETLAGGVLVFGLLLPDDGAYSAQPVRFVGGNYEASHKGGLWWNVNATVELLTVRNAPSNRTPPFPQFMRLAVDPTASQILKTSHRNARLTVRPGLGSITTLRIFPPTDPTQYLYFGINNQGDGDTLITSQDVDPIPPETIPGFPVALPNVNVSFNLRADRRTVRAEMDSGHTRQFTASKVTQKTYQVEWEFSLAELAIFQEFFFVTIKSGAGPFTLDLPIDGTFAAQTVRFVGGKYSESYVATDRFKISATVERFVAQTVAPPAWQPFGLYYTPGVNVTANRKIGDADAGKLFIVNPAPGQTISLHIYSRLIEFGVLVVGLGNVLITRGPFVLAIETIGDTAAGSFNQSTFELRDTIRDIGTLPGDMGTGVFGQCTFAMLSVVEDIGTLPGDMGTGVFLQNMTLELKDVLEDLGTLTGDAASGTFAKPTFELVIP